MKKTRAGFILVEAIAAVVTISICLTFIAQALLTNFRAGVRFQEGVRSLLAMENRVGLLCASNGSADQLLSAPQSLEEPYDKFTIHAKTDDINDRLKQVQLTINWPKGKGQRGLDVTTIIYNPDQVKTRSYIP
ncbi:MAG: hypothetical protein HY591_06915 [Candidatus Omnitrophica bacterium]|nr:hypothetical protein [Candidatus Omnitrophota bacterium]